MKGTNKDQRRRVSHNQEVVSCPASEPTPFNTMWQDNAAYGASSNQNNFYGQGNQPNVPLQFYDQSSFYLGSRSSLEGNVAAQGSIVQPGTAGYTGSIQPAGGWWTAFGTGGFEGEPPLLEGACAVMSLVLLYVRSHHKLNLSLPTLRTRHQFPSHRSQVHDGSEPLPPG